MLPIAKLIAFIIGHLPLCLVRVLGKALGRIAFRFDKRHAKTALENMTLAYKGSLSEDAMTTIARGVFENLAITGLEFMRIPWLTKTGLNGYVEFKGIENLERALERKKGAILFTAHFGNWELMAAAYGLSGFPIDIVVRELDSPVAEAFTAWVRIASGNRLVEKNRSMRKLIKTLSVNGIAGILLDQNVADVEGVFVDFFGTSACTNKGPALLAQMTGAAMLPTFIVRHGKGHTIVVGEQVELIDTGDKHADAIENTARCTKIIEGQVRAHPEQWFWVHRRWKTRPSKAVNREP
ncbi:MAG: lysophospholipid acyltransferase family protein [Deltaproteobacteria bacterium]|nr:lysophospholipid acyltransferase family protein [Deltaproteobacteria bacterium]